MNNFGVNIISVSAFIVMILTICSFGVKNDLNLKSVIKLLPILSAYSLLPMGSLPPFFRYTYGFPLLILLLCADIFAAKERVKKIPFAVSVVFFYAVLYLYAPKTGMPGNIYGTSAYAAWSAASGCGIYAKAAVILFFIGLCVSALIISEDEENVQKLFPCAFIVSFFFHMQHSWKLHMTGIFAYAFDMILFWTAVYALYFITLSIKKKITNGKVKRIIFFFPFACSLFGAFLLAADYALF